MKVVQHRDALSVGMLVHDAYWLVHFDVSGALKSSMRAADRIVAASVLAELIDIGQIAVEADHVILQETAPIADRLLASVHRQLAEDSALHPVDVIDGLVPGVRERVADHLVASKRAIRRRSGWRQVAVRREGDLAPAAVEADLVDSVVQGRRLTDGQWLLATLLHHAGGDGFLLNTLPSGMVARALAGETVATRRYRHLVNAAVSSLRAISVSA
ncbi:GPP34 family phosphoprotein [Actinoplanes sp. Pm04-4]|uniref:GPP34 family phosphoprotein n=1 Tax=Paractinoplanes pyxinae TaxID=2997416 RepID=A0ABT4B4R8_9ACTN|nr:GPP34 family phosphoprotein [Actinoplanes pyxinae]MCY1141479.1 GPP34 family phosphoprotein [Actinoplanes pyxinae]